MKEIDPYKSSSPSCIHPRILKECGPNLASALTKLFKLSLKSGTLPTSWKEGTVTPLYKGGDRHQPSSFRPITLTSLICRLMEKIIKEAIIQYLTDTDVLFDGQHGFLPGRSCLSNLLETLDEITSLHDKGNLVDEVFLDLQKAFDKVPHQRLLFKLHQIGIRDEVLNWIEGFLSNRKQRVSLRQHASKWKKVTSGVPQGSVLGPLLFVIYVNDINRNLKSSMKMFADDSKLYGPANTVEDADVIQEDLNVLNDWCNTWMVKFNPSKCHVLHYGKKNKNFLYHLNGELLQHVKEEKDLGVIISDDLKPAKDINENIKKANKMIGIIKHTFTYMDKYMFLKLYKSYVRPHLEYCQQVSNPWLQKDIDALEKVQRRATKLVPGLADLPYEDRLKALDLYSLESRRLRGDMILMFKIMKGLTNIKKSDLFISKSSNIKTRGHPYKVELHKTCSSEIRNKFFTERVIIPWNNLPSEVATSKSIEHFKWNYDISHGYHNKST